MKGQGKKSLARRREHEDEIKLLYFEKNWPLVDVQRRLANKRNFHASKSQYETCFKRLGLKKNSSKAERRGKFALTECEDIASSDPSPDFRQRRARATACNTASQRNDAGTPGFLAPANPKPSGSSCALLSDSPNRRSENGLSSAESEDQSATRSHFLSAQCQSSLQSGKWRARQIKSDLSRRKSSILPEDIDSEGLAILWSPYRAPKVLAARLASQQKNLPDTKFADFCKKLVQHAIHAGDPEGLSICLDFAGPSATSIRLAYGDATLTLPELAASLHSLRILKLLRDRGFDLKQCGPYTSSIHKMGTDGPLLCALKGFSRKRGYGWEKSWMAQSETVVFLASFITTTDDKKNLDQYAHCLETVMHWPEPDFHHLLSALQSNSSLTFVLSVVVAWIQGPAKLEEPASTFNGHIQTESTSTSYRPIQNDALLILVKASLKLALRSTSEHESRRELTLLLEEIIKQHSPAALSNFRILKGVESLVFIPGGSCSCGMEVNTCYQVQLSLLSPSSRSLPKPGQACMTLADGESGHGLDAAGKASSPAASYNRNDCFENLLSTINSTDEPTALGLLETTTREGIDKLFSGLKSITEAENTLLMAAVKRQHTALVRKLLNIRECIFVIDWSLHGEIVQGTDCATLLVLEDLRHSGAVYGLIGSALETGDGEMLDKLIARGAVFDYHQLQKASQSLSRDFVLRALGRSIDIPIFDKTLFEVRGTDRSKIEVTKNDMNNFDPFDGPVYCARHFSTPLLIAAKTGRTEHAIPNMRYTMDIFALVLDLPELSKRFSHDTAQGTSVLGQLLILDVSPEQEVTHLVLEKFGSCIGIDRAAKLTESQVWTPLLLAICHRRDHVCRTLVTTYKADVNYPPKKGVIYTPLQLAAAVGAFKTAEWLLLEGASVNGPINQNGGNTALQLAAKRGDVDLTNLLIRHGADINAPGPAISAKTALEVAGEHGHLEVMKILLQRGCWTTDLGQAELDRALNLASGRDKISIIECLRQFKN